MDLSRFVRGTEPVQNSPGRPATINTRRLAVASQAKIAPRGRFTPASPKPKPSAAPPDPRPFQSSQDEDDEDIERFEEFGVFDSTIHSDFDLSTLNGDVEDRRAISDIESQHADDFDDDKTYKVGDDQRRRRIDFQLPPQQLQGQSYPSAYDGTGPPQLSRIRQQFDMFQAGAMPAKPTQTQAPKAVVSAYKPPTSSNRFSSGNQGWHAIKSSSPERVKNYEEDKSEPPPSSQPRTQSPPPNLPSSGRENIDEKNGPKGSSQGELPDSSGFFGESDSELASVASSPSERTPQAPKRQLSNRMEVDLDYEVEALEHMEYADLANEPFDSNPRAVKPTRSAAPGGPLEERLEDYLQESPHSQRAMLAQLSLSEWEQAGDWFVERFTKAMTDLKEARHAKRQVVADFEAEIANREETVRNKKDGLDGLLREMRTGGETVLRGTPTPRRR